ncbi:MAG: 2-amino-4-hydroxy-6-hydroxymethyldihydropteridine diphosphokinase [Flavihumibacter sp.]|nr:2-amino-4-hydroxy-6-hydroxymethyldihydropteridine diphosphokinase [Flavihumibacter sp.]
MNTSYLLIGGNLGNRPQNLANAIIAIKEQCGIITRLSPIYETAAWGNTNQPSFLNQALALDTQLEPEQLLQQLLAIETSMGRIRSEKFGPRTIDIDILLYGSAVISTGNLTVPHPHLPNRRFALLPLVTIAPHYLHPQLNMTITALLQQCNDDLPLSLFAQ